MERIMIQIEPTTNPLYVAYEYSGVAACYCRYMMNRLADGEDASWSMAMTIDAYARMLAAEMQITEAHLEDLRQDDIARRRESVATAKRLVRTACRELDKYGVPVASYVRHLLERPPLELTGVFAHSEHGYKSNYYILKKAKYAQLCRSMVHEWASYVGQGDGDE